MGGGKPVSMTHRDYIPKGTPAERLASVGKGGTSYYDPKKKQYYKVVHEDMTAGQYQQVYGEGSGGQHPIHDPNKLYDLVRGTIPQLGRKATINLVRAKTGLKGWSPGKNMQYSGNDLHGMSLAELKGLARDSGYRGPMGAKFNRQRAVDFLMHATPSPADVHHHPG